MASFITPIKSGKIPTLIAHQIKNAILNGTMQPGDQLPPERELSERFGASRIAIREALKGLEASGLLVIKPGSGVFVASVTSKTMSESFYSILRMQKTSINEVTEARLILEPHIARLATEKAVEKDFVRLEANINGAMRAMSEGRPPVAENIEFHLILVEMMHNTALNLTMTTLLDVVNTMSSDGTENLPQRMQVSRKSLNQHKKIVKALRERGSEKVYELMLKHIVEIQGGLARAIPKSK
jgi:DNA-binding FadR family transcriptional regulator